MKDGSVGKIHRLYDVVLVVELQQGDGGKNAPFISYRYPSMYEQDPFTASVTQFCFPDMNQFPTERMENEAFSFVLTEGDGERRFGYCLRRLPMGTGPRYPVAYSIMSYFPCFPLYTKILQEMANRYENVSMKDLTAFVDSVLQHRFPAPGESFTIQVLGGATSFTRPNDTDSQLQHLELADILTELDERTILIVFVSLLLERRIIFCSSKLSTLSSCIQAAMAMVYPLTWQHIYIPVLPKSLLTFVCAPMPFVVGILRTELNEVLSLPMDEVLIVDVDNNHFIRTPAASETEDLELLPPNYVSSLRRSLKSAIKVMKKSEKEKKKDRRSELADKQLQNEVKLAQEELTTAFISFFVSILSGYREYLSGGRLDRDAFIAGQPAMIQPFLEALTSSQMFQCFLDERRSGMADSGFERRMDAFQRAEKEKQSPVDDGQEVSIRRVSKKPNSSSIKFIGATLRNQFSWGEEAVAEPAIIEIGAPSLVGGTNPAVALHEGKQFQLPAEALSRQVLHPIGAGKQFKPLLASASERRALPLTDIQHSSSVPLDLNKARFAPKLTVERTLSAGEGTAPPPLPPLLKVAPPRPPRTGSPLTQPHSPLGMERKSVTRRATAGSPQEHEIIRARGPGSASPLSRAVTDHSVNGTKKGELIPPPQRKRPDSVKLVTPLSQLPSQQPQPSHLRRNGLPASTMIAPTPASLPDRPIPVSIPLPPSTHSTTPNPIPRHVGRALPALPPTT